MFFEGNCSTSSFRNGPLSESSQSDSISWLQELIQGDLGWSKQSTLQNSCLEFWDRCAFFHVIDCGCSFLLALGNLALRWSLHCGWQNEETKRNFICLLDQATLKQILPWILVAWAKNSLYCLNPLNWNCVTYNWVLTDTISRIPDLDVYLCIM